MKIILALFVCLCCLESVKLLRTWRETNGRRVFAELSSRQGVRKWAQFVDGQLKGWFDRDDGGIDTVTLFQYSEPNIHVKNHVVKMVLTPNAFFTLNRRPHEITGSGKWDTIVPQPRQPMPQPAPQPILITDKHSQ